MVRGIPDDLAVNSELARLERLTANSMSRGAPSFEEIGAKISERLRSAVTAAVGAVMATQPGVRVRAFCDKVGDWLLHNGGGQLVRVGDMPLRDGETPLVDMVEELRELISAEIEQHGSESAVVVALRALESALEALVPRKPEQPRSKRTRRERFWRSD
jgi:hypothetical protein